MKELKIIVDNLAIKGGVENVVVSIANGMASKNKKVTIVCVKKCIPAFKINECVSVKFLITRLTKVKKYYSLISYFRRETGKNDIIYTNSVANTLLAVIFASKKAEIYACDHNQYNAVNKFWAGLRVLLYRRLSGVIVLTNYDLVKYLRLNPNSVVFNNPVNDDFFNIPYSLDKIKDKYILNIGRLEIQKGQDLLLHAWKLVDKKGVSLWICGDGSKRKDLEKLVVELGLTSSVKFLGNRDDINILLHHAYCNILSSRFEGKPVSLIEAKVVGCPSISFDCKTGPSEIIVDREDGLLVENGNIQKLAESIQFIIDNPNVRNLFAQNTRYDRDKYSNDTITNQYIDFFRL
ncbi:TPA: glycosyltransferase family 4 protein [Salmonella enterica]|nr:glycosyltransferase family 4 protein [Salmonella enterica]ECE4238060.1 glycosyltransferase family 4 protein [Salmonella enterica]EDZ1187333.1 glycosyltransferase family 4 protein [Salmonella enterica]EHW9405165.1 glycosyltransferase family 4 protein [Salmonella enterica]MBA3118090.1 glycosyltransferase family 4 protein [Salmonella enterica]